MTTASTAAYNFRARTALPHSAKRSRKAQKSSGFRATGTYGHCIKDNVLLDPCCGSGGMFVQSEKFIHTDKKNAIRVYGQESNPDTWKIAKMNMFLHGINADLGHGNADTFTSDLHHELKADFILANPPFNYHPWGQQQLLKDGRWKYGIPPARNANFAWIQHMLSHLSPDGKIGLVLSNSSMTDTTCGQKDIRKKIIEDGIVDGIIALPPNLFNNTGIAACLWILSGHSSDKKETLFIDARNMGHMEDRTHRVLSEADILRISNVFQSFLRGNRYETEGVYCGAADIHKIAENDYVLSPGRYVKYKNRKRLFADAADIDEELKTLSAELDKLFTESHLVEEEIKKRFQKEGNYYV